MSEIVLEVSNLRKDYPSGEGEITVLSDINFTLSAGESVAIVGKSGSGKTTLLGLAAGLDKATDGAVNLLGIDLGSLTEDGRAKLRGQKTGFVFQSFQLLPSLTALENVMIPLELLKEKNVSERAMESLRSVGLEDRADHYPTALSGGEQQRVALARAFVHKPQILFADEPTGNLDAETSIQIEELLFKLNEEMGTTLVLVTHDMELAQKTNRILQLKAGALISDSAVPAKVTEASSDEVSA